MEKLRIKLLIINNKLSEFESLLSPFLLISITVNTMLCMSNICNLVTNHSQTTGFIRYISAVNIFGSVVKLFIYFYFGEKIPKSFNHLKKKLEALVFSRSLSTDDWRQWIAIKEMKKQFHFSVMKSFKMRRETALTIALFILQYAVILIQTSI